MKSGSMYHAAKFFVISFFVMMCAKLPRNIIWESDKDKPMKAYQQDFIEFAIEQGVLCFGEYTLKSGRISPYFFNAGLFQTGASLSKLGAFYAQSIVDYGVEPVHSPLAGELPEGERAKVVDQAIYEALRQQGVDQAELDRVHCPIGLSIGADTPEEIAVSIMAQLIDERSNSLA